MLACEYGREGRAEQVNFICWHVLTFEGFLPDMVKKLIGCPALHFFLFHCRSRLATVTVSLPSTSGSETEDERDVISLLCSIFVANHGAGQAAGEDGWLSLVRNYLVLFLGIEINTSCSIKLMRNLVLQEDEESVLQEVKEAEKRAVEAYSALLLAFLSTERSAWCHT